MLILTRRVGETLIIGDVVVTVLVSKELARIGINAPKDVSVHREEIYQRIQQENATPATEAEVKPKEKVKRTRARNSNSIFQFRHF